MSNLGVKIKKLRQAQHMTLEEVGNIVGVGKSTVRKWETGEIANMRRDKIVLLARALGTTPAYLMEWEDLSEHSLDMHKYGLMPIAKQKIPLLGDIACGKPIFMNEDRESYIMSGMEIKADFCLRAKGDSMINARILDGDIVFIRKQDIVANGEIAAVSIDDEATLKRVYYYPDQNRLVLAAENTAYPPLVYEGEQLTNIYILGKAVAFQSDVR